MDCSQAGCKYQHVQVLSYRTQSLVSALRVGPSNVLGNQGSAPVEIRRQVKGKTPIGKIPLALQWIVGERHVFSVSTLNTSFTNPLEEMLA